jgi:hypothetical protein
MESRTTGRSPAVANQALLLQTGTRWGTAPVRFLNIGRQAATLLANARPGPGELVRICLLEPLQTDWVLATVVGGELTGDAPYAMEVSFHKPLPDDVVSKLTQHHGPVELA